MRAWALPLTLSARTSPLPAAPCWPLLPGPRDVLTAGPVTQTLSITSLASPQTLALLPALPALTYLSLDLDSSAWINHAREPDQPWLAGLSALTALTHLSIHNMVRVRCDNMAQGAGPGVRRGRHD